VGSQRTPLLDFKLPTGDAMVMNTVVLTMSISGFDNIFNSSDEHPHFLTHRNSTTGNSALGPSTGGGLVALRDGHTGSVGQRFPQRVRLFGKHFLIAAAFGVGIRACTSAAAGFRAWYWGTC